MTPIQRWLLAFALVIVAVAISYEWLDRPIAFFSYALHPGPKQALFEPLTHIPDPLIPGAAIAFVVLGLWALAGRPLSRWQATVLLCSVSLPVASAIKEQLKYVFGRTWPETWVQNNPSLIHDGVYGFNFFRSGAGYSSFPSGHTTLTCAIVSVLWIVYPRYRPIYGAVVLAVAIGLLGADFHFLSDVIAGGFVGTSTGWMATVLYDELATKPLVKS